MDVRRLTGEPLRTYVAVFEPGEEIVEGLTSCARDAELDAAHVTAIGAVSSATVGWFDLDRRDYRPLSFDEQLEILSLVGDITGPPLDGGDDPVVHLHAVFGRIDGAAIGGHLLEGVVRPTLEVVVTETPAGLRRRHDPATGLALIDLGASRVPSDIPTRPGRTP